MDYKPIVEDMMSEIYVKAYNAENAAYSKVLGRAAGTRPTKRRIKRLPAVVLSIAVMGIVTVSAGAAINWDIGLLFSNYNDTRQSISAESKKLTNWYLERDMYDAGGSELYKKTENYDEILSNIVHPVDKLCEYDDMNIYVNGYVYDGYVLEVYYDVIRKTPRLFGETDDLIGSPHSFTSPVGNVHMGGNRVYAEEGNTKKCLWKCYYRLPEDVDESLYMLLPSHINRENDLTSAELESIYIDRAFTVKKPDISGYVYEVEPDLPLEMTDGKHASVEYLLISPISVEFGGSMCEEDFRSINPTPVYVEYDDGEILDLSSWTSSDGNGAAGQFNGEPGFYKCVDTNGNILDVTHIRSIKLFDRTIEIDPQSVS